MSSAQQKTRWIVHGAIVLAGIIIVAANFGTEIFSVGGGQQETIDREALAKVAPAMTDRAYHRNYESEQQCITCHTQQVLNAPQIPHEPRARCAECHQIAT
ncbi:MAG TPA: hypothetical protein VKA68_15300 [bacterium]|nr:hypothetical protein [bacterium]